VKRQSGARPMVARRSGLSGHDAAPDGCRRRPALGSAHLPCMPAARDQSGQFEQANGAGLVGVDDDGIIGCTPDDEGDHAVVTDRGLPVPAVGAVDGERLLGCCRATRSTDGRRHGNP